MKRKIMVMRYENEQKENKSKMNKIKNKINN